MVKATKWIISLILAMGVAALSVIIALSYKSLELNEVGLDYDTVNHNIDPNTLYRRGRHYIGIGHSFKVFPYIFL